MAITEDMLSPYMRQRLIEQNKQPPKSTIVQTYNANQILLITPLVKFYIDQGLEIGNITQFVQYIPSKCFAPFTSKVYKMRCEAEHEQDPIKSTTAKLFGNRNVKKK